MKTIVKCCIEKDGKLLVLKRGSTVHVWPNCWDFPGGTQDPDDTSDEETLLRETEEELGSSVIVGEKLRTIVWDMRDQGTPTHRMHIYSAQLTAEPKLSFEHTELRWLSIQEIEALPLDPFLRQFLHLKEHPDSWV